jgi:fumarate reductase flavoprotein subunit
VPIKTPPFHAVKRDTSNFTATITMGGLRINAKAQVIDVFGKVIPRLYAAGRTSGGNMGEMYPGSGSSIGSALTFGRIAGKNAAAEFHWEE